MAASVLAFNVKESELAKLKTVCGGMGISLKAVDRELYGCRLGAIADGSAEPCASPEGDFTEPLLVMASFSRRQFDIFLKRPEAAGVPLKAVMTEHNAEWTPLRLYGELCAEREAFRRGGKPVHNGARVGRKRPC